MTRRENFPVYSYLPRVILGLALNVVFGGRRSFHRDSQVCIGRLKPSLHVFGKKNIPQAGPCLITFNHYYRPGFDAWWMALALAAVVPVEIHFVMTGELTFPGKWYAPVGMFGSRLLLRRLARLYGFTTMPPMPPRPGDVAERARSVRQALSFVCHNPQAIIGLAPEGGDQLGGVLTLPPAGAGRFISLLAASGLRIVPVGIYEQYGALCLNFGQGYDLEFRCDLSLGERDHAIASTVMCKIAALLPIALRGVFAG